MSNMRNTALNLLRTNGLVISRLVLEHVDQDVILAGLRFHFEVESRFDECDDIVLEEPFENRHRKMTPWLDSKGNHFWIVTEADRSLTTVFLPEEI